VHACTPQQRDCAREADRHGADGRHHVPAPADVGVGDEQAVELRLIAQRGARLGRPVEARHRDHVGPELLDHAARIRDPLAVDRRGRRRTTRRCERSDGSNGEGFPDHVADDTTPLRDNSLSS
jgi:hypothetical protein